MLKLTVNFVAGGVFPEESVMTLLNYHHYFFQSQYFYNLILFCSNRSNIKFARKTLCLLVLNIYFYFNGNGEAANVIFNIKMYIFMKQ